MKCPYCDGVPFSGSGAWGYCSRCKGTGKITFMPKRSHIDDKTLAMLTETEVRKRKQVSIDDRLAMIEIVEAVKKLSPLICMGVDEDGLYFQKRVTNGYAHGLPRFRVRKKSLCFDNKV